MWSLRHLAATAGLLSAALPSYAAQTIVPFTVSATVVRGCAISATNLSFGVYAPNAPAASNGTSTVTVTCQLDDRFRIGLSEGSNVSGTQRRLANPAAPADFLSYNLFRDEARTLPWADTGQTRLEGNGTGAAQSFTVWGQIPGAQNVPVGTYADTVTVVVRN
jgi:spore coat protein U-like protein